MCDIASRAVSWLQISDMQNCLTFKINIVIHYMIRVKKENSMIISTEAENVLYNHQCLLMTFKSHQIPVVERNSLNLGKIFLKTTTVNTSFLKW